MWECSRIRSTSPAPPSSSRQLPGRGLVEPHQRRVQFERSGHAEIERGLQRLDGLVAAIRIAGIIGLAHAADDVGDAAPVGQRRGEGQEHQIAAGHEGVGQAVGAHRDRDIAGQRGIGNLRQRRNLQGVAVAEPGRPIRAQRLHAVEQIGAAFEFDGVALAVVEAERFDPRKALQRPGQTGRGILPAGEQHQRGLVLEPVVDLLAHGRAHSTPRRAAPIGGNRCRAGSFCWDGPRVLRHTGGINLRTGASCSLPATSKACSTSWRRCERPAAAARGTSNRILRASRPTPSRRPMRSPTPSRAAISTTSATNSAISCCRWCFTPAWRRNRARSRSATWSRPSPAR